MTFRDGAGGAGFGPTTTFDAPVWSVFGPEGLGPEYLSIDTGMASGVWSPAASTALIFPALLAEPWTVDRFYWANGAAVSGNVCAALYDENFVRLVTTGSVAQAGVSTIQEANVGDVLVVGPGAFYFALVLDNIVGTVIRATMPAALVSDANGLKQMAAAFPLPDPLVPALITTVSVPLAGFTSRALV